MQVTLYNNLADPRTVNKLNKMTAIDTVEAEPFYPLQISTPVFRLKYNNNIKGINYAYVPELARYYFVGDSTLESGNTMIIPCECDVLMSFRSDIVNLKCVCLRNQHKFNEYITDDLPSSVKATTTNYVMFSDTPFFVPQNDSTFCYILTLNGLVGGT